MTAGTHQSSMHSADWPKGHPVLELAAANAARTFIRAIVAISRRKGRSLDVPLLISIVDDDEEVRSALEVLFQSTGFDARVFADAETFLDSPEARRSNCIISDIQMPKLTGFDLSQALRERDVNTPVILISAFATEATSEIADRVGAYCVMEKPFEPEALIDRVRAAMKDKTTH